MPGGERTILNASAPRMNKNHKDLLYQVGDFSKVERLRQYANF
jgi:hypothetical protein